MPVISYACRVSSSCRNLPTFFLFIQVLHSDVASVVVDVLNVMDHETLVFDNTEERQKLCCLMKELENWLGDTLIKERLEIDTLQDCNILKAKKVFYTRFIKTKTKLFYKQQKFNLLREESEGYAKLITELNQEIEDTVTPAYLLQVCHSKPCGVNKSLSSLHFPY